MRSANGDGGDVSKSGNGAAEHRLAKDTTSCRGNRRDRRCTFRNSSSRQPKISSVNATQRSPSTQCEIASWSRFGASLKQSRCCSIGPNRRISNSRIAPTLENLRDMHRLRLSSLSMSALRIAKYRSLLLDSSSGSPAPIRAQRLYQPKPT
jgi:hypothetical protein